MDKMVGKIKNLMTAKTMGELPVGEPEMGFSFISIYPTVSLGKNVVIGNYITIHDGCVLGDNVVIEDNVVINKQVKIGNNTRICSGSIILEGVKIGDDCMIENHCLVDSQTMIGNKVFIGAGSSLVCDRSINYKRKNIEGKEGKIVVDNSVRIGARSVILSNVEIGKNALVFAGSVVLVSVDKYEMVSGNPAINIGIVRKEHRI